MNLYEIKDELEKAVEECVDVETGEITNPERLDALNMALGEKRENIALFIKNLNADVTARSTEIDNLTARNKRDKKKIEWLKSYLASDLQGHKFETPRVKVSFRRSEQLEILSTEAIPKEFLIEQPPKVAKLQLKNVIKSGGQFNGVSLVEKLNIQIR